ncbi:MAG: methyltransferase domain-containing protein [Magnetococcales bacterium]|nr:methyltransferase domain-containing protein [Magnetococcales bacterium]
MSDDRVIWERRWQGSDVKERLTLLGRLMFRAKERAMVDLLRRIPSGSVMEVGCGLGHILAIYQREGWPCQGIDISPTAVAVCHNKGLTVALRAVEEETGGYDLVSSDGMLEHFLHFEPMAEHLMRLSRRHVLIIQPNHGSLVGKTLPYLAELLRGDEIVFEYNYRMRDFVEVFQKHGFALQESIPVFFDVFRILLFQRTLESSQPVTSPMA